MPIGSFYFILSVCVSVANFGFLGNLIRLVCCIIFTGFGNVLLKVEVFNRNYRINSNAVRWLILIGMACDRLPT